MTSLEDEFAIILIMSMPEDVDSGGLRDDLKALEGSGLTFNLKELGERRPTALPAITS